MESIYKKINMLYSVIMTVLTAVFGDYWFLFMGFIIANVVDYCTGWAKSKYYGVESSNKGAKGILKKVGYWVVIAISFFISFAFVKMGELLEIPLEFVVFFGWFTLATYMINEVRSIFENLVEMGVNVPSWLIKGLEVASHTVESKIEAQEHIFNNYHEQNKGEKQ